MYNQVLISTWSFFSKKKKNTHLIEYKELLVIEIPNCEANWENSVWTDFHS